MNSTYLLEYDFVNQYIQEINDVSGIDDIPATMSYCNTYHGRYHNYFILIIKIQVPEPGQPRSLLAANDIIFGNDVIGKFDNNTLPEYPLRKCEWLNI